MNRSTPLLGAACLALAAANLLPESAPAQIAITPRIVQIDTIKCEVLLAADRERHERLLVYFNGYVDGTRRQTTWDERIVGEVVERALGYCKADPGETVLSAFTRAAR